MKNISYNKKFYKFAKIFTVCAVIISVISSVTAANSEEWASVNSAVIDAGDKISGNFNTFTGDNRYYYGNNNTIYTNNSVIDGNFNTIYGDNNTIKGNNNTIHGEDNNISGNFNKFTPDADNMVSNGNNNREIIE